MALTKVHTRMFEGSYLNVLDFGATGNGSTDDSSAIQSALNTATNAVYFPSGNYYIAGATLTVPDNVQIYGNGKNSLITIDASVRPDPYNDHIFIAGSNTIFRDLTIDGDRGDAVQEIRSIFIDNENNVSIDNVTFSNHGVAIWAGYADNIKITNCDFTSDTSKVHIVTSGTASGFSSNLFIQNNFFGTTVEEAIDVNDKTRSVIIDSNSFFNNHTGSDIDGTEVIDIGGTTPCLDLIITNNRVNNNSAADAFVWVKLGSERVIVSGNTITNLKTSSGSSAVRISNSKNIDVIGNTVVNATRLSILQEKSSTITSEHINISQNTASNISEEGIFIDTHTASPKDIIIDGNTFSDLSSSSRCIYVIQSDKIVISNNALSGFGNDGISLLANCVNAIVSGNVVDNCSDALSIASPSCVISSNNCSNSNVIGLRLSSVNCTVNGNIFNSNSSDGIALAATSDKASVTGNVCTGNAGSGINVAASTADAALVGNVLAGNTTSSIANAGNLTGASVNANNVV
jgi:hypothetical protein